MTAGLNPAVAAPALMKLWYAIGFALAEDGKTCGIWSKYG